MSIYMSEYRLIKDLEAYAERLGFCIGPDRYAGDRIALYPGEPDQLPCYSRDATLWSGSANELLVFLRGWEARMTYDRMIGFSQKKVERCEQNVRNDLLLLKLKSQKKAEDEQQ